MKSFPSEHGAAAAGRSSGHQHGEICQPAVLLNPFCPLTTAKVLALKATVLLLLTLLIKARGPGVGRLTTESIPANNEP